MCRELTVSLLIGCLIGSTWIQKSKSNMLTPKSNLLTFLPKEIFGEMSEIPLCVCSTSCVFRHILVAIRKVLALEWWVSDGKSPTYQSGVARPVERGRLITRIGISKWEYSEMLKNAREKTAFQMAMRSSSKHCMVVCGIPRVYETEQNLCYPKFMKVALLGKDSLPWHIIIWCTSFSQCHKWWQFRMQRLHRTRNQKSSKQFQHGVWEKSRAKTEVILEAQRDKSESTLLHWWTYATSRMHS